MGRDSPLVVPPAAAAAVGGSQGRGSLPLVALGTGVVQAAAGVGSPAGGSLVAGSPCRGCRDCSLQASGGLGSPDRGS